MRAKLTVLSACCVALGLASSSVLAQSRVTLYGVIDEGIMYLNNTGGPTGGKKVFLDALSGIQGSRWGMTGTEDLGGGLRAIFTMESGVNINNGAFGQGGTPFGRQVFVGLSSDRFGSATFGRQYDMITYFAQIVTSQGPLAGSALFAHPGDLDNTANSLRVNNSIRYMSPSYAGFTFGGEYSVGGIAGDTTANSGYSVGAGYSNGPVTLGAAYAFFKNPTSATAGSGFFTGNASGSSPLSGVLNRGYVSAKAYQVVIAGASYVMGPVILGTSYSNVQYANLGGTLLGQTARFNTADFTVRYTFGPALFFSAAYVYTQGKSVQTTAGATVGNQHFNQVSLMADYFLSKRTDIFLEGAYQKASGTSSTGTAAVGAIGNLGDSSNNHQIGMRLSLRHKF
jgi:predicted porin